jgi:Kef-type K+ transport system membrane component KefB
MSHADLLSLVIVVAASVAAVLLADALRRLLVPLVIVEILLGVVVGPSVLGLAHVTSLIRAAAELGVCMLFFLAAYELDLQRIKSIRLSLVGAGWLLSLGLGLCVAAVLAALGLTQGVMAVGLALTTTALGVLMPILRDAGIVESSLGPLMLGFGAVGEFGPIVLLALLFGTGSPLRAVVLLGVFAVIVATVAVSGRRMRPERHLWLMHSTLSTSAQFAVRGTILVCLSLVLLADRLDLDILLGAFCAGAVVRLIDPLGDTGILRSRVDAIGFGFFIPLFFITTGMSLDLHAFISGPVVVLLVLVFVVAFLAVRGTPVLLFGSLLRAGDRAVLALFSATALPLVIVITTTATRSGAMDQTTASALVGAGMVSVLVFPWLALRVAGRGRRLRVSGLASDAAVITSARHGGPV